MEHQDRLSAGLLNDLKKLRPRSTTAKNIKKDFFRRVACRV
jgi:hypothetical protein